jgi:8-hydroxy-5-deazaflavin:NADPH oxidoreductase
LTQLRSRERNHRAVADSAGVWSGKILIDAMNPFGVPPAELKGQASSDVVASAFEGAKVVKAFNHLPAKVLAMDPAESGGRRVLFVSSNDEAASMAVGKLLDALGFASIGLGKITEGGALFAMGGPLVLQNLIKLG